MVKCIILYSICIPVLSHVSHITITLQDILTVKLELDNGKTCHFFFSLFLNDLEEFLLTKDIVGLKSITDELETELEIYLKIFVMLYADDTILLAESAEDLQVQLNAFGEYCDNWEMKVNVNKTKIMVFGFGKLRQNLKFTY